MEKKLATALELFRQKNPDIKSKDLQNFVSGWNACKENIKECNCVSFEIENKKFVCKNCNKEYKELKC